VDVAFGNPGLLKIDKIKVGYSFADVPHGKADYEQINYFVNVTCKDQSFARSFSQASKKHAWTEGWVELDKDVWLEVAFGYTPSGHRAFFQFNPSKLTPKARATLEAATMLCLYEEWEGLAKNGHVSYVEFAYDVVGAGYSDFLCIDTRLQSINDMYMKVGGFYLGAKRARRRIAFYDKEYELFKNHKLVLGHRLLRLEACLRPPTKQRLCDLPKLVNPFAPTIVIDRKLLECCTPSFRMERFRKRVLIQGKNAQDAFSMAVGSGQAKKEFVQELCSLAPPWWNPTAIWEGAPATLDWF